MCKLKPEAVERYRELHQRVWPELELAYSKKGISEIVCFLRGNDLFIYSERTESEAIDVDDAPGDIERKWQQLMEPLHDQRVEKVNLAPVYCMAIQEDIQGVPSEAGT